jgi:hypothetical protein
MSAKKLEASGVLYTDRRDFYIDPQIVKELWTDVAPFTTVLSNKETRQVKDPMFKMFEHRNPWVKQKFVNNGYTTSLAANDTESGAITIDGIEGLASSVDSSYIGLEVEVWNTGETTRKGVVLITSAPSATTIKVKNLTDGAIGFMMLLQQWIDLKNLKTCQQVLQT